MYLQRSLSKNKPKVLPSLTPLRSKTCKDHPQRYLQRSPTNLQRSLTNIKPKRLCSKVFFTAYHVAMHDTGYAKSLVSVANLGITEQMSDDISDEILRRGGQGWFGHWAVGPNYGLHLFWSNSGPNRTNNFRGHVPHTGEQQSKDKKRIWSKTFNWGRLILPGLPAGSYYHDTKSNKAQASKLH